ncbi:MAG: hypothetical protein IH859_04235 [Chloroflexi bacterium]|nr:hypothetical protein [Chloroflexota bacterium]
MSSKDTQFKLEALMADFEVRGAKAIKELREENLVEYMNMITDLILMEQSGEELL